MSFDMNNLYLPNINDLLGHPPLGIEFLLPHRFWALAALVGLALVIQVLAHPRSEV